MAWKYQDNSRGNQTLSGRFSPLLSPSQSISGHNCSEIKYFYLPRKDDQTLRLTFMCIIKGQYFLCFCFYFTLSLDV